MEREALNLAIEKKQISDRYVNGYDILASEFNTQGGLNVFGEVVFSDWQQDHATAQFDLDGQVHWRKVIQTQPAPRIRLYPEGGAK